MARHRVNLTVLAGSVATLAASWIGVAAADSRAATSVSEEPVAPIVASAPPPPADQPEAVARLLAEAAQSPKPLPPVQLVPRQLAVPRGELLDLAALTQVRMPDVTISASGSGASSAATRAAAPPPAAAPPVSAPTIGLPTLAPVVVPPPPPIVFTAPAPQAAPVVVAAPPPPPAPPPVTTKSKAS